MFPPHAPHPTLGAAFFAAPLLFEWPWMMPRQVFEPACGHAGFLVAAMRLLTELLPPDRATPASRRNYLRKPVHGCEIDPFALEIARLSLTLADIPNPNGWDLVPGVGLFTKVINISDLTSMIAVGPPMFYGARAFNGPSCPWAP